MFPHIKESYKVERYHFNFYFKFNQSLNRTKKFFLDKIINLNNINYYETKHELKIIN